MHLDGGARRHHQAEPIEHQGLRRRCREPRRAADRARRQPHYVDIGGGTIRRIKYTAGANQAPVAVATATPTSGDIGMTVSFDGSGSSDPDGDPLSHAWDLDGDGGFDDSTAAKPIWTYNAAGS